MHSELPTRNGPTRTGRNSGLRSSLKRRSSPSCRDSAARSSTDLNLKYRAKEDLKSRDQRSGEGTLAAWLLASPRESRYNSSAGRVMEWQTCMTQKHVP